MAPQQPYPLDWEPRLIVAAWAGSPPPVSQPVRFRSSFTLPKPVVTADLWMTACGVFEAEINGSVVGDHVLSPGWTSYHHRHRLIHHDVGPLLSDGRNAIGVTVAEGWYRGRIGFGGGVREIYGSEIGPIALLAITHPDGTVTRVVTDEGWSADPSPIVASSLYDGETLDAARLDPAWSQPVFDDSDWSGVEARPFDVRPLFVPVSPPVRRIEAIAPVSIDYRESGRAIVDFGQNIAGRLQMEVPAAPGRTITVRHAEVLEHGEPAFRPLRGAAATDRIICGADALTWEPRFTIHGFRYAQIEGWPGELTSDDLRAVVCHTDFDELGEFECSNALLNRFHENARWSARGNFVDIPTDCPQRDERLGWTGDLQVFGDAAFFLFDCASMIESWLEDLAAEQIEHDTVPIYVPWVQLMIPPVPMAAWGDAAVVVPWLLYQHFGDPAVLRRQYTSMCSWVDQITDLAGDDLLWKPGLQFGDWLDPIAPPDRPASGRTSPELVAVAYHAYSAGLVAQVARVIGEDADAARYGRLAVAIRKAFQAEFVTPNGLMASDSQTAYALALQFDLLSTADHRARAASRLRDLVERDGFHIGTGFVGTPLVCDALVDGGYPDDAYHLLLQTEVPSWLYPVTMGATTIWERWDSMLPDGSVNPGEMTSFNHYALGAVASFLHRRVAGLGPAAPGYSRLAIRPLPGGGLSYAEASRELPTGRARVRWDRAGDEFRLHLEVPDGVVAEVEMPDGSS
ncbi:MAG: family 78 glycoside hydrolase catalytic domain, partial [Acidimicrobiia bacterium]